MKNRANTLAAILGNMEDLEGAYKDALNAEGSALKENTAYLDSIQGRIDLFNNSVQTMWMNFINDDVIKFFVDIGTGLMKLVDLINPLNVAIAGLFGGMFAKYKMKKNNTDILSLLFETVPKNIKNSPAIQNFASTVKTAFAEAMGNAVSNANSLDILAELANFDDANNVLGDLANIFGNKSVTKDQTKEVLDSFDDISDATKEAILNSNLFAVSQTGAAAGTNIFTASLVKAKAAVIGFAKGLWALITAHPAIAIVTGLTVALGAFWGLYNKYGPTHENYIKKLEEETEELKNVQSKLKSVNEELQTTKARIEELQDKKTLSFVEEEELNRLKEQTAELERQEQILLAQEKRARNKQIDAALNAIKTDPNESGSINTKSSMTNGIYYAASQQHDLYIYNNPYAAGFQSGDLVSDENKYENALSSLQKAKEDLENAETELAKTTYKAESNEYKELEKTVEEAKSRVDTYNNAIDSMNETWQTEYGEIGYIENATTEAEKQWNEYYRQHQDYLDRQALINNDYGKSTVLDRVFGATGTDVAKRFKKEFESAVKSGKDPADVIDELFANKKYSSAFTGLEEQFEITLDNIKDYFTQTGEFAINPEFDITKYTKTISSHSAVISEFQEAIQKLGKGSFTMDDFVSLVERFPEMAKGVDISSNAFYGLSRNLNKAIKSRTKSFINDLKKLKESLKAAGKETDSIDQLITAVENMPADALDDITQKYSTLADEMERAKTANDRLLASMEENPNAEYENRGEALEYMKEAMKNGEIGSESNLWNVAKEYGFTGYDTSDINASADALAKFIAVRDRWWKTEDDGDDRTNDGYSYKGTENFIKDVEAAVGANEELAKILEWDYDETTGSFNFDFDNKNLDSIISLLSKTEGLIGLTKEEWMDLMVQIGQYFNVNWEDADDLKDHITMIADGSGTAAEKIEQMTDATETYVERVLGQDLDFSNLTEASIEALDCDESIKQLLKTYLSLKESLEDPLGLENLMETSGSLAPLVDMGNLKGSITQNDYGYQVVNTDIFTEALKEAGYTEEKITSLIAKIKEYKGVLVVTNDDPLGLNSQNASMMSIISNLSTLGIGYDTVRGQLGQPIGINITASDLITTLQEKGWEPNQIKSYLQDLSSEENGLGIQIDGKVNMSTEEIDAVIAKSNEVPEEEKTKYTVDGNGVVTLQSIIDAWAKVPLDVDTSYTINETTIKKTINKGESDDFNLFKPSTWFDNENEHGISVNGTAHANGSWGAPKSETALVGELGPEMLVRNGRWTTVGENGAEFTQVKKGDIIFNHKQTKQLLENGYVTGRGKLQGGAFASGTAFVSGGGTFGRYTFDGQGGWTEYDVNGNVVDSTSALSGALDDAADTVNEFEETIDWIEIRMEEFDERIGMISAQLDNLHTAAEKNAKIDELIALNQEKYANALAGASYYEQYAQQYLKGMNDNLIAAAKNGAIAITEFTKEQDEATVNAIQNYREYIQKAADLQQQAEEMITEISNLAKQAIDNIAQDYENKNSIENDIKIEQLEAYNSLIEAINGTESSAIYEALTKETNEKIALLEQQRNDMQTELNRKVQDGQIEVGDQNWYDAVNAIAEVDTEIINLTKDTEDYQDAINNLKWDNFDKLIDKLDSVSDEADDLIDILSNKDLVDDEGNWTDEGITALGLQAQKMEVAEKQVREYSEAIEDLEKDYQDGKYSEQEYQEKLEELKDGQRDAIKSYHDAKDAIVDLNKERVDAIKDGIQKEIDAYEELIKAKKEELDAEKDLYDFQKSIMDQQKDIADIERQLAALSNDNSASARAKRAQLEAELAEANAELQDSYYERSISNQQEALDKELENFQEEKDKEMESWDKYLEETETVVADSLSTVQANTQVVYQTLDAMGQEYSLSISDALTSPWEDGSFAIQSYTEVFGDAISSTMEELDKLETKYDELNAKIEESGKQSIDKVDNNVVEYTKAEKVEPEVTEPPKTENKKEEPKKPSLTKGSYIEVKSGTKWYTDSYGGGDWGYAKSGTIKYVNESGSHPYNIDGLGWVKKKDIVGYYKGTGPNGVSKDQWAVLDELGDELQLVPDGNGRLAYVKKGTTILNNKMTERLMDLAMNPQEMLDRNRPEIKLPSEISNTEIKIDNSIAELIHIDNCSTESLPDVKKIVNEALDKHMQRLNNSLRKYTR